MRQGKSERAGAAHLVDWAGPDLGGAPVHPAGERRPPRLVAHGERGRSGAGEGHQHRHGRRRACTAQHGPPGGSLHCPPWRVYRLAPQFNPLRASAVTLFVGCANTIHFKPGAASEGRRAGGEVKRDVVRAVAWIATAEHRNAWAAATVGVEGIALGVTLVPGVQRSFHPASSRRSEGSRDPPRKPLWRRRKTPRGSRDP